jgi:protein TonB
MAYAERMPNRSKTLTVITVAGLHGIALYALVTGLGVEYITTVATVLTGSNIPIERVSPPPPEPTPTEVTLAPRSAEPTTRPSVVDSVPNPLGTTENMVLDFPLKPFPPATFDPPGPIGPASSAAEKPLFTPRVVQPRGDPGLWVSTSDYPSSSLRRGEQGMVRFEVGVGTDGRVSDCRVTASSGSADLDAATCRYVSKRAKFEPATDNTGARVTGTYSGSIRWLIPQG